MTASEMCQVCHQAPRDDRECLDGWIEGEPLAEGYAPAMSRCKAWVALLKATSQAQGMAAAGLDDAKYTAGWDDLTLEHKSWKAARELAGMVGTVVSQGLNIVMSGPTGTGKTHAAVLICRAAATAGHSSMKLDWSRFLDSLRDGFNDRTQEPEGKRIERLCQADLLLLDDVAAGGDDGKFSTSRLEKIISARYNAQRPTILTANLRVQNLQEMLGDRAASRIHSRVIEIVFDGKRHREATERREVSDLINAVWQGAAK